MPVALAFTLIAAAALASEQPAAQPADSSTITVTAERNPKRRIADFVRALTPVHSGQQLSRFEQSVCPAVSGLPPAQERAVAERLRSVAHSVGLAVVSARCDPNLVVIVTPDKTALLEQLRKQRPEYFGDLSGSDIRRILRQPGPAAAWQLDGAMLNARGVAIRTDPSYGVPINRTTDPGSMITAAARPQFAAAIVVVDQRALAGLTTTQLADYAAMRALARTDPSKLAPNAPSILGILEAPMGASVPVTLTDWDFGFLRGLYTSDPTLRPGAQRSAIANTVAKRIQQQRSSEPQPPRRDRN